MAVVVDDHLLIELLADAGPPWLAEASVSSVVYTTASWYFRVASAAERGSGTGSLSGRIANLPESAQLVVRDRISRLPTSVELIGPRRLVPLMAGLRTPRRLNYLASEALALAVLTEATITVRTESPLLREACEALRVGYELDVP